MSVEHRLGQSGAVMLEYLVVLCFTGVIVVLAVAPWLGPTVVDEYSRRRAVLYSASP